MSTIENPALRAFLGRLGDGLVMAQVAIQRAGGGYALQHVDDRNAAPESLRVVALKDVRALAQHTEAGEFRPLKSAPTLRRGWRLVVASDAELELALNQLYPGAVADWFAAQAAQPPVTNYREYTSCQSGMYRVTAKLSDEQASEVIHECCAASRCLKRRLWSVTGLAPDAAEAKSLIPCLEPCAILLESARKSARETQQNGGSLAACAEADPG